jgi:hypothetical protein
VTGVEILHPSFREMRNSRTYVYAGSRHHSVDGSYRFFIAVGNYTLWCVASRDISGTISTSSERMTVGTESDIETGSRSTSLIVSAIANTHLDDIVKKVKHTHYRPCRPRRVWKI